VFPDCVVLVTVLGLPVVGTPPERLFFLFAQ
jgi:hypothetical protein